jgi:transposase InsO family protein
VAFVVDDVEYATPEWVAWFNTQRLLEPLGYLPPAEYEARCYRSQHATVLARN